ncbi:hypothetical protein [Paraburkholderia sp. RL18-085-BIA-A]|uniref:hypothetical protein n=2 Tax=Burkholderiaceae TaxID=119060 RepID=UPI0038B6FFF7
MMTLLIYLAGWIILIGGVSWGLMTLHVAQHTIEIVAVILLGVAVITGATRARSRDRSSPNAHPAQWTFLGPGASLRAPLASSHGSRQRPAPPSAKLAHKTNQNRCPHPPNRTGGPHRSPVSLPTPHFLAPF